MEVIKKALKIMFWRTEFYGGSPEGGTSSLHLGKIRGFNNLGHKCVYVSSGPMDLPDYVKYYYIPYNKLLRNFPEVLSLPYNGKSIREIKKIIDIEKPDFIYQHHHDFHYGGAVLKKKYGIPYVLHVDGVEIWIKANWGKLYFKNLLKWAEEIQIDYSDAIVVPSQTLADLVVEIVGCKREKIFVAPNGVDTEQFHPGIKGELVREKLSLKDKIICGFTGTFGHWHGVEVLAKAMKYVIKEVPNAVFLFVGDGMLRSNIDTIAKEDNVDKNLIITGFLPIGVIPEYVAACDVVVSPCVNNDDGRFFNSPVKLFEYMAMEKPIVATNVGQQGEVIIDDYNGLSCEEKNPEVLAHQIIRLIKDKDLANRLSRQARLDSIEKHHWKYNSQIIIDAYEYGLKNRT